MICYRSTDIQSFPMRHKRYCIFIHNSIPIFLPREYYQSGKMVDNVHQNCYNFINGAIPLLYMLFVQRYMQTA